MAGVPLGPYVGARLERPAEQGETFLDLTQTGGYEGAVAIIEIAAAHGPLPTLRQSCCQRAVRIAPAQQLIEPGPVHAMAMHGTQMAALFLDPGQGTDAALAHAGDLLDRRDIRCGEHGLLAPEQLLELRQRAALLAQQRREILPADLRIHRLFP